MFDNIEINCPCCQKSFNYYFKNFVVDTRAYLKTQKSCII